MFFLNLLAASLKVHLNMIAGKPYLEKKAQADLVKAVRHAGSKVPYYRDAFKNAGIDPRDFKSPNDLKKLPFITKEEVRRAFPEKIVAQGADIGQCHYSATTGSTGRSLPFIYSPATYAFYLATNLRVYTMIGYRPWYRCSYIKYTPIDPVNWGPFFKFDHIPSVMDVERQIEMLKANKPDMIDGYASIMLEIARKVSHSDLKVIRPRIILLNSEMSTDHERQLISDVFSCPVYDEYSTEETWMVASQCRNHNYHLFTDNVWVEFLDENGNEVAPGEAGEIVLTTLRSPAMPFIRYRIGDVGRLSLKSCDCGSPFPRLESFEGRADDGFILSNGSYVSSLKILNTFTMHIKKYLHLMDAFQVIQKTRDDVSILLVKGKKYNTEQFREVTDALQRLLGETVRIKVEMTDHINKPGGVKRKAIVSLAQ